MNSKNDLHYMRQALALALKGKGKTHPNPMVGCLIVRDGAVVGTGWHEFFGGPHAEVNALAAAGEKSRGATLYVSLEPCNHWGKTPPCAESIIKAGVARVVAAMSDPNPLTCNRGIQRLKKNGIAVTTGVLRREAERLNRDYLCHIEKSRPLVTIKAAMSLDGKIASRSGDSKWITCQKARDYVHRLRAQYDAILIGAGTVTADNPFLTSHGKGKDPVRVIIDPSLRTPAQSNVVNGEPPSVIVYQLPGDDKKIERLREKGAILVGLMRENGRISFKTIVNKLQEISLRRIFIEGGGETIAAALADGVVDDALIFVSPRFIGGRTAPTPVEGEGVERVAESLKLGRMSVRRVGDDLLISAAIKKHCKS